MKANAKIKLNCIILKMWRKGEKLHGKGTIMDGWILGEGMANLLKDGFHRWNIAKKIIFTKIEVFLIRFNLVEINLIKIKVQIKWEPKKHKKNYNKYPDKYILNWI